MLSEGEKKVYLALYLNKEGLHVREICRISGLTLPAVSKHLENGEKEGRLTIQTKGNMKICRLNFGSPGIAPLIQTIELDRLKKLPHAARESFTSFISDLNEKPLMSIVFGSFAKGSSSKASDLDILLVFQRLDSRLMKSVEDSARKIKGRTGVSIQPVCLAYPEFEKEILGRENEFMKDIRKNGMALKGHDLYLNLLGRFYG